MTYIILKPEIPTVFCVICLEARAGLEDVDKRQIPGSAWSLTHIPQFLTSILVTRSIKLMPLQNVPERSAKFVFHG